MFKAKLDQNGLFLGLEEVMEIPEGDIELSEDCGLKAGKYRWNGSSFIPLPKSQHKAAPDVPSYEEALFALISELTSDSFNRGVIPKQCSDWAEWYKKSIGAAR